MLSRWAIAVYLLFQPACTQPPPPPDQALLSLVQNTAEWSTDNASYFNDPKLIDKIGDIHDATNRSFDQVARIKFDFTGPQTTILSYFPENNWPIIDPTDPTNPPPPVEANMRWYATWVQNQRNQNYAFGVFWVLGPPTNHPAPSQGVSPLCGQQRKILGVTLDDPFTDNEVPTNVRSRGTVMFAGWIHELSGCSGFSGKELNMYIRAHTHEMGHQRAGLTHASNFNYHTGPVPNINQGRDVMEADIVAGDLSKKVPLFDQHFEQATESSPCLHLTCQDNLVCWRSITN